MIDRDGAGGWDRVKQLFGDALELDDDARAALLARLAREEPEAHGELASLLAGHERAGDFMAEPTIAPAEQALVATEGPGAGTGTGTGSGVPARDAEVPPPEPEPDPEHVGRYRIEERLGQGGMGRVYLAHDPQLGRRVALKVLPERLARDADWRARFVREARAAARLNHPNITTIHDVGEAEGLDYIAFEYVKGETLAAGLARGARSLEAALEIAIPIADALAYAHEQGIVHRDVKAANVMVTERGLPKLLDFGIAKLVDAAPDGAHARGRRDGAERAAADDEVSPALTRSGAVVGTPGAMSPEQALGERVDRRTDVFSFGALLYELLAGRPAFAAPTAAGTMDAVVNADPEPLARLRPDLPPALASIVARALRKAPRDRYQDMGALAADLRAQQAELGTRTFVAAQARERMTSRAVVATIAVVATLALAIVASRDRARPSPPGAAPPRPPQAGVLYFENLADPADADRTGAMLSHLVTASLVQGGDLDVVSQQRLFDVARLLGREDGSIDRAVASEVARRAGLTVMVLGRVGRIGDALVASAEVVDVDSGATLDAAEARGGSADEVFAMADALGTRIRRALDAPDVTPEERSALERLTTSVDAYRAYVRGREALQRNEIDTAVAAFEEATTIDPAFALAYFHEALALTWTGAHDASRLAVARAHAFRDRLPDDVRPLLQVLDFGDDTTAALPVLLEVLEGDPYNRDALFMIGEIYTHSATRNDAWAAIVVYERLLESDPGFSPVFDHLLCADLRLGRFEHARARLAGWRDAPAEELSALAGTLALWEGRLEEAARTIDEPLWARALLDDHEEPALAAILAADVDEIVATLEGVEGLYRVMSLDMHANVLAAHGRFDDAATLYRLTADVPGEMTSAGYLTSARLGARQRHAALMALRGDVSGARYEVEQTLALQPESPRTLYVAARFALLDGDEDAARGHVELLTMLGPPSTPTTVLYRDAARASLALAQGRAEEAATLCEALLASGRLLEDWYAHEDSLGPWVRETLAHARRAQGEADGAIAALDGLVESGLERLRHPLPWVLALHERGRLRLLRGDAQGGRDDLRRVLDHWGRADAPLDVVREARSLLGE